MICQYVDIEVFADLDKLWGDRAHRTIVCREGFVELGHPAADCGGLLYQIDLVSRVCQVEGGLHPAYTAADNHHRTNFALTVVHIHHTYPGTRASTGLGSTKCLFHHLL